MKKTGIVMLLLLWLIPGAMAVGKGGKVPQYDIAGAGSGTEGTVLVKVYVYGSKASDAELKRAAVHGVVFRGVSSGNQSGSRQPAMAAPAAESDNAAFCDRFFAADGECQRYASVVAGSYERVKTSKGYKCGAILQVDKAALRKVLEAAGVVRPLSKGF